MIFAVIITYKNPEKLEKCLASFEGQTNFRRGDHSLIKYVRDNSNDNILYTAGINLGIREALTEGADHILVCCDDVTLRPDSIHELAKYLDENEDCAIAMPIQVSPTTGKVTCGGCTRAWPSGWHVTEPLGHELYKAPFESFWANGACFMVRADAVRECGLMDEGMRFICSDSDWSFTMRARGWKIFVVPTAIVEHEPDGAMHYKNEFIEKTKDEDSLYFMKKWLTGGLFQELSQEGPTLKVQEIVDRLTILQGRLAHGYTKD